MKLCIHNNCIRLRLSQTEVSELARGKNIREQLSLPAKNSKDFSYALVPNPDIDAIMATFFKDEILVQLPSLEIMDWAKSNRVGISKSIKTNEGRNLTIDIEKDFKCLHKRTGEDESDNFPHPAAK